MMADSVADLLAKLQFVGGPVETLYLNETRVHESFIGQLGEVDKFTRTATKEGSIEAPIVKLGAGMSAEAGVTWTLTDPVTQALVLRSSLESQELLYSLAEAGPGRYTSFTGTGHISRPGMLDDEHRAALSDYPGFYDALEAERDSQEKIRRMMEKDNPNMWLLTVSSEAAVCAAVIDNRWLRPSFPSWVSPGTRWEVLAMVRHRHELGIPLLAALHVTVKW
jgi:hypothetical protein